MVQKIVTFDVALKSTERQWVQKIPEVYTNDLGSVSLQFRITDCTDTELTGSTAIVLLKMRDGSFFQGPPVDVTRTLNAFSYTLKENEGNHDGLAEIQLIVTIGAKEFATQKYNFKVITGIDSEVAREIMIYDWSTLTAEARAYIDQFTADEALRDAEFDNAQFDRNVAFKAAQTQRVITFNSSEAARVQLFNSKETDRAAGYTADHSRAETDHTGATTDRANAETDRTNAATDRTNAAADRTLAGTDHTTASGDHTTALSDHAVLGGYNGRLTDVETDTSFDGTNKILNGDFSNGTTGWTADSATLSVASNKLTVTATVTGPGNKVHQGIDSVVGNKYYIGITIGRVGAHANSLRLQFGTSDNYTAIKIISTLGVERHSIITKATLAYSYLEVKMENLNAIGDAFYIERPIVLDLTTIFGAGNEPTVELMDAIMAKFENSWFDGTKNLFQAKTSLNKLIALDQEKANKVQEAWITPTLLNRAIQDPQHPVQYYKDQFGRVNFRGKASNILNDKALFTMPTGYRTPVNESYTSMIVPRSAMGTNVARIIIDGGWGRGVVYAITPATDIVHFDGFNYSVEV